MPEIGIEAHAHTYNGVFKAIYIVSVNCKHLLVTPTLLLLGTRLK